MYDANPHYIIANLGFIMPNNLLSLAIPLGYAQCKLNFFNIKLTYLCIGSGSSGSDSLSTGAAVTVTFAVTFISTLTVTAIITFAVTYFCVKRKIEKINNLKLQPLQEKVAVYEQVSSPDNTFTKHDLPLQLNPAYCTSHNVTIDANSAYESCK